MKKFGIIIDKNCNTQSIQAFQIPISKAGISVMITSSRVYFTLSPLRAPFYSSRPVGARQKEATRLPVTLDRLESYLREEPKKIIRYSLPYWYVIVE